MSFEDLDLEKDAELKRLYREEHEERVGDLRAILQTPAGKRYMWWLLERTHMFSSTFTGNSTGHFLEGERNIGLMIFKDVLKVNPKLMGQMAQSHAAKIQSLKEKRADLKKE